MCNYSGIIILTVSLFLFVSFKRIETQVQPYVARILMARSLLESIIPAIVSLFIGPWSDKFGRRPIVLTTFTGKLKNKIITKQINQKLMLEKSCIDRKHQQLSVSG